MGFLHKVFGSAPLEPSAAVAKALETAEAVRSIPEVGGDPAKNRELVGIIETLKATESGLRTGKDHEGLPVTPAELADRLTRMLGYMKQRGIWARLTAKAGGETKSRLGQMEKDIAEAAKALRG